MVSFSASLVCRADRVRVAEVSYYVSFGEAVEDTKKEGTVNTSLERKEAGSRSLAVIASIHTHQ